MVDITSLIERYPDQIVDFFEKRVSEIEDEVEMKVGDLLREKEELEEAIRIIGAKNRLRAFNKVLKPNLMNSGGYSSGMPNIDKIIFFTREKPLTITEIAEKIVEKEPNQLLDNVKNVLSAVTAMDAKKDNPRLNRIQNDNGKWIYMAK